MHYEAALLYAMVGGGGGLQLAIKFQLPTFVSLTLVNVESGNKLRLVDSGSIRKHSRWHYRGW